MRELNEPTHYHDDDEFDELNDVMAADVRKSSFVNSEKCAADSGIVFDSEEPKTGSKFSISSHESSKHLLKDKNLNDSGIDSIGRFSSIREFQSKQSLSIKSSSVSTMAVPLREVRVPSKIRSKRYSLPDIDKLKHYDGAAKKSALTRNATQCDTKLEPQATIPLVPTEANALVNMAKVDNFTIDPKLINKYDGLSQSLYFIDENGSPKIRERYIKQQRMMIEKQEQKRREKESRRDTEGSCSCFNFSRLSKKLRELCE